jgi:hypothetical protein
VALGEICRLLAERAPEDASATARLRTAKERLKVLHQADPGQRAVWEPLAAAYRRLGESSNLVELLAEVLPHVDDAVARAQLLWERVRTMVHALGAGDPEVEPLLRTIVDEDPGLLLEAGRMLAGILERSGAQGELAALLERQMEVAKDRSDSVAVASLALQLGSLLRETDVAQARNVFYIGLDWDDKNRDLLDALIALLGADSDAGERADLMERRIALEAV